MRDGYYVICPMLPELRRQPIAAPALTAEYSSSEVTLDRGALETLLAPYRDGDGEGAGAAGMKIVTLFGTRPEIIRLSRIIPSLDRLCTQVLVHTGQNSDPQLSDVFFTELGVRAAGRPPGDRGAGSFAAQAAAILEESGEVLERERPDRVLILGDTNSGLAAIVAARLGIPGVPHGGGQPVLRRPRARGDQPPDHRSLQHRADAVHRAQQGQPGARRHRAGSHLRDRQSHLRSADALSAADRWRATC